MDAMEKMALMVSSAEEAIKKIQKYAELGFTDVVLINSSPDRGRLIKPVAEQVAPAVGMPRSTAAQA